MMNIQLARDMFSEALTALLDGAPLVISVYTDKEAMTLNVSRETFRVENNDERE